MIGLTLDSFPARRTHKEPCLEVVKQDFQTMSLVGFLTNAGISMTYEYCIMKPEPGWVSNSGTGTLVPELPVSDWSTAFEILAERNG